jgi:HD-GYP domain-containing protein (c-di-GMP phosphodiesterase class II)
LATSEARHPELETTVVRGLEAAVAGVHRDGNISPHLVALLHAGLTRLLAQEPRLELRCAGLYLDFNGARLPRGEHDRTQTRRLLRALRAARLQGLRFEAGLTVTELQRALEIVARSARPGDLWCEVPRRFQRAGVCKVVACECEAGEALQFPAGVGFSVHRAAAQRLYLEGARLYREALVAAVEKQPLPLYAIRRLLQRMVDLFEEDDAPLLGLTSVKHIEGYELTHAVNVTILSLAVAREAGLAKPHIERIGLAAFLHDIGQLDVPPGLAEREGALSGDERRQVRRHTLHGALRLLDAGSLEYTAAAALTALEHHLSMWGEGYPKLPAGWTPSLAAQIIHVTDTYDALTSRPVYRQRAVRPDRVMAYLMDNAGLRFDPTLVRHLVALLGIYPPGTTVQLDNQDIGVVVRPNRDAVRWHRPQVCLAVDGAGKPIEKDPIVDLAAIDAAAGGFCRSVSRCVDPEGFEIAPAAAFTR